MVGWVSPTFVLLAFILGHTEAFWEGTEPASCFPAPKIHYQSTCCSHLQEPAVGGTITDKFNIGLYQAALYSKYPQTFMTDVNRAKLCSPFRGKIRVTGSAGEDIGEATAEWTGNQGSCLKVTLKVPSQQKCWTHWHAYLSEDSFVGQTSFPDFATSAQWKTSGPIRVCGSDSSIVIDNLCPTTPTTCSSNLYFAFHLTMTSGDDAWVVPQTPIGSNEYDGDGVLSSSQSCPGRCYSSSYKVQCSPSQLSTVEKEDCGTVSFAINGNSFSVNFAPTPGYALESVDFYLGKSQYPPFSHTEWLFQYSVFSTQMPTKYNPLASITSTSFSVSYDLGLPIYALNGAQVTCGENFKFAFSITAKKNGNVPVLGHAALPLPIPDTASWGKYAEITRCCVNPTIRSSLQCPDKPQCHRVSEFKDDFRWSVPGTQITLLRCCAFDQVSNILQDLLPDGKKPYSGFTSGNVVATCESGSTPGSSCSMSITWLSENTDYRDVVGYYIWNPTTKTLDKSFFTSTNGLGPLWPDTSGLSSQGCLASGDTIQVTVPAGASIGWFLKMNGANYTPTGRNDASTFYSVVDYVTSGGLRNSDGYDSSNPSLPTRHFAWVNLEGFNSIIMGIEDIYGMGDRDFNEAIFALKLNGSWKTPGVLSYDVCTETVKDTQPFNPYSFAQYVYTPECIPHIILDPTVGLSAEKKECNAFYTVPDGWEIAMMDSFGKEIARTFGSSWNTPCVVGRNATGTGYVGWSISGPCNAPVRTLPGTVTGFNLGCQGHLLLRQKAVAPKCNIKTYGTYCNQSPSDYAVPNANTPESWRIYLTPNVERQVAFSVPLYYRLQLFILIDTFGITVKPDDDVTNVAKTVPYALKYSGVYPEKGLSVGYGYTIDASSVVVQQSLTTDFAKLFSASKPVISGPSTKSNILQAVANLLLNSNQVNVGWDPNTFRVVYVVIKSLPSFSTKDLDVFRTTMISSGVGVVFCVPNSATRTALVSALGADIPRWAAVVIPYPKIDLGLAETRIETEVAQPWLEDAFTGQRQVVGKITIEEVSTDKDPSFSTPPLITPIPKFGIDLRSKLPSATTLMYYTTLPAIFKLPPGVPGATSASLMPYTVKYRFVETGYKFDAVISWNERPALLAPTLKYYFTDATPAPYTVPIVDSIRSKLDPNVNKLDIVFRTASYFYTIPASGFIGSMSLYGGDHDGLEVSLTTATSSDFLRRFNALGLKFAPKGGDVHSTGTWILEYELTDHCLSSAIGKIEITYEESATPPPTCQNVEAIMVVATPKTWDLADLVTETQLGECDPQPVSQVACPNNVAPSDCNRCVPNTDCCNDGPMLGICQSSTTNDCPDGGKAICNGGNCPLGIKCETLVPCNTRKCFGSISCGPKGCPLGYQHGMFCHYDGISKEIKVCCAQQSPHELKLEVLTDLRDVFGFVTYESSPNLWTPITYNYPSVDYGVLTFSPYDGQIGTGVWYYRVISSTGAYAQCTATIIISPPRPPLISITPKEIVTTLDTFGQWSVTISDPDGGLVSMYLYDQSVVDYSAIEASSFGLVSNAYNSHLLAPGVSLIVQDLDLTPKAGHSDTFEMRWKPLLTHPVGLVHTLYFYAKDSTNLRSGIASITLKTNHPPVWGVTPDPTKFYQYTAWFPLTTPGTDPNLADTEKLSVKIDVLPTKGTLYIGSLSEPVVVGRIYDYRTYAAAPGSPKYVAGKTSMLFLLAPLGRDEAFGPDKFCGSFFDPMNAKGDGCTEFTLTPEAPPRVNDVNVKTTCETKTLIKIPAYDTDGNLVSLTITDLEFHVSSMLTYTDASGVIHTIIDGVPEVISVPSGSGFEFTFQFDYYTSAYEVNTDKFTFEAKDARGKTSGLHVATINTPDCPQKPFAWGETFTTPEDTPIKIPFDYGSNPTTSNYFDKDGTVQKTKIIITSYPDNGELKTPTGEVQLGFEYGYPLPEFSFAPAFNWNGETRFNFKSKDEDGLESDLATMTIIVTAVDDPPVIRLTPSLLKVHRDGQDTFTVTVSDVDSDTIVVYAKDFSNFPFACATPTDGTAQVECSTLVGPDFTYSTTKAFSLTEPLKTIANIVGSDIEHTFTLVWKPKQIFFPDDKSGSFKVYAKADGQISVQEPQGTVTIFPNDPPKIRDVGQYYKEVDQNSAPVTLFLMATDPQPYHDTVLKIELLSVPVTGVTVSLPGSPTAYTPHVLANSEPGGEASLGQVDGTRAQVQLNFAVNYHGTVTFKFQAIDALGAISKEQIVTVVVKFVNQPPTTSDVFLFLSENDCSTLPCGKKATLSGTDIDDLTLSLLFTSAASFDATKGRLSWFSDQTLPLVDRPYADDCTGLPCTTSWVVNYQPVTYKHSTCTGYTPTDTDDQVKAKCEAYVTYSFKVVDSLDHEATATLYIYVRPVEQPPRTFDVTKQADPNVPLDLVIKGEDPDNNLANLFITSVNFKTIDGATATLTFGGAPVMLNQAYPVTGTTWTFVYTGPHTVENVDTFTYHVTDATGLLSTPDNTGTVTMLRIIKPPVVAGDEFTTDEDVAINIPFIYGQTENRFDIDGSAETTRIIITELLPAGTGTLKFGGEVITSPNFYIVPSGTENPFVVYTPPPNWNGITQFKFIAIDADNVISETDATMQITVNAINDPPLIFLRPPELNVYRTKSDFFTVEVRDEDSDSITVHITSLTGELSTLVYSDFTFLDSTKTVQTIFTSTNLPPSQLVTIPNPVKGASHFLYLSWGPKLNTPDGTTGTLKVKAKDDELFSLNEPMGTVRVRPNIAPVTRENPPNSYTLVFNQNSAPQTVNLQGTDTDTWHDKVLAVTITSGSSDLHMQIKSVSGDVTYTANSDVPRVDGIFSDGTAAPVKLHFDTNWFGTAEFKFIVTDLLGDFSAERIVTVTILHVNQPPTTNNVVLVVPENYCVWGCKSPPQLSRVITAQDVDAGDFLTLKLGSLPTGGSLGRSLATGEIEKVTSSNPVYASNWKFWFQPTATRHSRCDVGFNPTDGTGCDAYAVIPFTVYDLEGSSASGTFTIIVTPVEYNPVTYDFFSTEREVTVVLTGTDRDNNIREIKITGMQLSTHTTLEYGGVNVNINDIFPGTGTWSFTYKYDSRLVNTDTFTYIVIDQTNLESNVGTAKIVVPLINDPPQVWGEEFTINEGESLPIHFVYGQNPPHHFFDPDGSQPDTTLRIFSLPDQGSLFDFENNPVLGTPNIPNSVLTWVPPSESFSGTTSFQFVAEDVHGAESPPATITIHVLPVDDPPVIAITPSSIEVDRAQTDKFLVSVKDEDSMTIDVHITNIQLPFGRNGVEYSTFTIEQLDGTVVKSYTLADQPVAESLVISFTYPMVSDIGSEMTFNIVWGPTVDAPDTAFGFFSLYAKADGAQSNIVTGNVAVTPNKPPVVVDNDSGPSWYEWTVDATSHLFTLVGTDPDPWHKTKLTVELLSLPTGMILRQNGVTIKPEDLPLSLTSVGKTETTEGYVTVAPTVGGWRASATFDFRVRDPFNAYSQDQPVKIIVDHANHDPTTSDHSLYIFENTCIMPYCGALADVSGIPHASLYGHDIDPGETETLTLKWESLPDPGTRGIIGFYPLGSRTINELLPSNGGFPKPHNWFFWFQPLRGLHSEGCDQNRQGCQPFTTAQFRVVDIHGAVSDVHTLTIYVFPVNNPPVSRDMVFTIKEDEELIVYFEGPDNVKVEKIPASDTDNTDTEIGAVVTSIDLDSRGTWFTRAGAQVSANQDTIVPGRYLKFVPPPNEFSDPLSSPMSTLNFKVFDLEPLFSVQYKIQVYVTPVPDKPIWIAPKRIRTYEDTEVLILLNNRDIHWTSADAGTGRIVITEKGKGYYSECDLNGCTPIETLPYTLKDGRLYFKGLQDENGDNYSVFKFTLEVIDDTGLANELTKLKGVTYTIDVIPVNDPPVLIPLWYPLTKNGPKNECDEDTYIRIAFNGTDIDSPFEILTADILSIVDPHKATAYVCTQKLSTKNCTDGVKIISIEKVERFSVAHWEITFVPAPNWNGLLRVDFVVWDEFLSSNVETVVIVVRPINDPPSIVKASTHFDLEKYEILAPDSYSYFSTGLDGTPFAINDGNSVPERVLEGKLVEPRIEMANTGQREFGSTGEGYKDENEKLLLVHRLRTQVQDADFFFEKSLSISLHLFNAHFIKPELIARKTRASASDQAPGCTLKGDYEMNCTAVITPLNFWLMTVGFPVVLNDDAGSGFMLVVLSDNGNIDKENRELTTSFTIQFAVPQPEEEYPVGIIVALPIIFGASAAAAAAAWLAFGSRAAEAAASNFDAFTVSAAGTGHASPLYVDENTENVSPLYFGHALRY